MNDNVFNGAEIGKIGRAIAWLHLQDWYERPFIVEKMRLHEDILKEDGSTVDAEIRIREDVFTAHTSCEGPIDTVNCALQEILVAHFPVLKNLNIDDLMAHIRPEGEKQGLASKVMAILWSSFVYDYSPAMKISESQLSKSTTRAAFLCLERMYEFCVLSKEIQQKALEAIKANQNGMAENHA